MYRGIPGRNDELWESQLLPLDKDSGFAVELSQTTQLTWEWRVWKGKETVTHWQDSPTDNEAVQKAAALILTIGNDCKMTENIQKMMNSTQDLTQKPVKTFDYPYLEDAGEEYNSYLIRRDDGYWCGMPSKYCDLEHADWMREHWERQLRLDSPVSKAEREAFEQEVSTLLINNKVVFTPLK